MHDLSYIKYIIWVLLITYINFGQNIDDKNILLVLVDDLRPLVDESIDLPNIMKMAGNGIHFKNAFVQQALCAPSRNSMLTGRRPDSLQLYDFDSYWRENVANFSTIPQLFKENGYDTFSMGKIFHPGKSSNYTDDYPYSWSKPTYHPPTEIYKNSPVCRDRETKKFQKNLICPVHVNKQPDKSLPDLQTVQYAINILEEQKSKNKPFFLAVGFHKPHIPLKFPKEYLERVPMNKVRCPKYPQMPAKMPLVSWHPWTDVRQRDDINRLNISFPLGTMPPKWSKKIKRSYFAAALFIDDLIGVLMSYVNRNNTIVVLTSDHGWSLGENGLWAKYSNFDVALKVPLILNIPGVARKEVDTPVELIDLFPTFVDITELSVNIPKCKNQHDKTVLCFEGKSLKPLFKDDNNVTEEYVAISQYPRPSIYPQINSDKPRLRDIIIMGYSIRTKTMRYTEWVSFNNTSFKMDWNSIHGIELYDHSVDPFEANNVFLESKYKTVAEYLSKMLRSKVDTF